MTTGTCDLWEQTFLGGVNPTDDCPLVPKAQVFDATTNPTGTRCDLADANVNILGTDPATGFARRPLDNVGIAYGLKALTDGVITPDQFLDLNAAVGGYDINGQIQPTRTVGDTEAFETAYGKGQVTEGEGLWKVPIILTNLYTDPYGDIHDRIRAFSLRDRMVHDDGTADPNLLIWTVPSAGLSVKALTGAIDDASSATEVLDRWLTAAKSAPGDDQEAKLDAARPADAVDTCHLPDGSVVSGPDTYTADNACTKAYPDPRRPPHRGRGAPPQRHLEVPAAARRPVHPAGAVHRRPASAPGHRVPRRAVRLDQARGRAGAHRGHLAQLRALTLSRPPPRPGGRRCPSRWRPAWG